VSADDDEIAPVSRPSWQLRSVLAVKSWLIRVCIDRKALAAKLADEKLSGELAVESDRHITRSALRS
jgi:hypothetical protein